jgi:hypothetical protein
MKLEDAKAALELPRGGSLLRISERNRFERRKSDLNSERSEFLEEWKDISDHIQIRRGRYLLDENRKNRRSRSKKVLNEKATFASRICGAGMLAGVSSPSRPWLKVATSDKDLNQSPSVKLWLDVVERLLYEVFASSNYYHVKQSGYRDMADFGQGPIVMDEDFENVINCYCSPPGEYFLDVNSRGIVDTMYRDMMMSTMMVMQKFWRSGAGSVPHEVQLAYDRGQYDKLWHIVSAVEPNTRQIKGERGPLGMPYVDVYYCMDVADHNGNAILRTTGANENKISAPRWEVQPGDVYGDGPGVLVLPSTRSLQILERRKGQMIDKMASPPVQAPSDKSGKSVVSHLPGAVSHYSSLQNGAGRAISPLYEVQGPQLQAVLMEQATLEGRIDTGYFVDLFLATINSTRRQVTATEIEERHEEKLIALGPVLERAHFEGLNVDVQRAYSILLRHGVLPPPPPEMEGNRLEVEYISLLATAQRAIGAGPIERLIGFIGNVSAGVPSALDKLDTDAAIDEYADVVGAPAIIVRSDEQVMKMRQERQQQQQAVEAQAMAAQSADTAQVLSQTDTARDSNLLADILGAQSQARLI